MQQQSTFDWMDHLKNQEVSCCNSYDSEYSEPNIPLERQAARPSMVRTANGSSKVQKLVDSIYDCIVVYITFLIMRLNLSKVINNQKCHHSKSKYTKSPNSKKVTRALQTSNLG